MISNGIWWTQWIHGVSQDLWMDKLPVVPARGGAEVALGLHAPCASQARACALCANLLHCCCPRTCPARDPGATQRQANTFFTHGTALFTPRTSHFTLALHIPHFISSQIMWALLTSSHLILSLLTCHLSKFFSIAFISSQHWSTFLISSKFFSTHLSCSARQKALTVREKSLAQKQNSGRRKLLHTEAWDTDHLHRKTSTAYFVRQRLYKHFPVLLCTTKLAQNISQHYFVLQSLHRIFPALLCTTKLAQSTSQYYFVLQSLHKARCTKYRIFPSTSLYYKACTEYFPVLLCTTKFAQSTSQYFFLLQSLHKARPATTLYYKACTKHFPVLLYMYYTACTEHFPVLLCTTKFAQNTSHYFLLQSLHKALPTSTLYYTACTEHFAVPLLYYKACTKYFPVLCTTQLAQSTSLYYLVLQSLHKAQSTKLAQSTSQYYFVPQSLHRALPSSTLYYKACTKHVPVLCTANLAQSRSTKQPLCQSKKTRFWSTF